MTALTRLANAIPLDPSDRGPVPVMADDLRAVVGALSRRTLADAIDNLDVATETYRRALSEDT